MRNKRGQLNYINFICNVDLCDIDMVIRIDEETYDCEKCALVDTVSKDVDCPFIRRGAVRGLI